MFAKDMQVSPVQPVVAANEVNWTLELLKIGIPVAATLFVGWWIARKNEGLKNSFAKEQSKFNVRDSRLHEKRVAAIEELVPLISDAKEVTTQTLDLAGFHHIVETENSIRLTGLTEVIGQFVDSKNIFFETAIAEKISYLNRGLKVFLLCISMAEAAFDWEPTIEMQNEKEERVKEALESILIAHSAIVDVCGYLEKEFRKELSPIPAEN